MKKTSFFRTKEGGLTAAVIVVMAAFVLTLFGLSADNAFAYGAGFILITAAMLYSPVKEKLINKFTKTGKKAQHG